MATVHHDPATTRTIRTTSNERLSLAFGFRAPLAVSIASIAGLGLGAAHGGQYAALRFRAENAHRLPRSQVGWYLYHKSKNYNVMLGGLKEGARMGGRLGFWTLTFVYFEEAIDRVRGATVRRWVGFREEKRRRKLGRDEMDELGVDRALAEDIYVQRDLFSTMTAALGVAGAFSLWNKFSVVTFAKTATMGLKAGFAFGVAQDALSLLRGKKLAYVELVRRRIFPARQDPQTVKTGG